MAHHIRILGRSDGKRFPENEITLAMAMSLYPEIFTKMIRASAVGARGIGITSHPETGRQPTTFIFALTRRTKITQRGIVEFLNRLAGEQHANQASNSEMATRRLG